MAITQNTFTGNGTTVLYPFTFSYLDESHVKATLNGTPTTDFTFANATTLQFNSAPGAGVAVVIFRETDSDQAEAVFAAGSPIRAADLNQNNTQLLYIAQETDRKAFEATATANSSVANANLALSVANAADVTATQAALDASNAVSTANQAAIDASTAISTANGAVSTANNAVSTANSAVSTANGAVNTANQANLNSQAAQADASQALIASSAAVVTANAAASDAGTALSQSNTAISDSAAALSAANAATITANNADSNATAAVSTANSAAADATNAIAAVSAAALYVIIADVAAIPGSPSNGDGVQIIDSTGIELFTPLSGVPVGFIGDPGLFVRLRYDSGLTSWVWVEYQANDPETRYGDAIGLAQADATQALSDAAAAQGDATQALSDAAAAQGDATQALSDAAAAQATANAALPKAGGTLTGDVVLANQTDIRFGEATINGSNYVGFQAPASITSDVLWTLPATDAAVSGYALKSDGAGNLSWGLAGGALGGGTDQVFYENDQTVTTNYTLGTGKNAVTAGPITINSGVTVTIPAGQSWIIV